MVIMEVCVECGVHVYILTVIQEEVELDFTVAWTVKEGLIQVVCFWWNCRWVVFS